ncbi:hypothetical protein D9M71_319450 [compost metagenome]
MCSKFRWRQLHNDGAKNFTCRVLSLAEDDFERGLSALINATTNSKRAIVCQIDQFLISFGYPSLRWNVPKKLERLRALGLLASSLLRKIVDVRNILEHEYKTPDLEFVKESLDIASVFVMSATAMFIPFDDVLEFSLPESSVRDNSVRALLSGWTESLGVFFTPSMRMSSTSFTVDALVNARFHQGI